MFESLVISLRSCDFELETAYLNSKFAKSGEKIQAPVALRMFFKSYECINFMLHLNFQLIIQGYMRFLRPSKVLTFSNLFLLRHQRYTVAVNALQHLYMAFTPSKSQYKITPYQLNQLKITLHHLRVLRISNISMRIFTKNIPYLAF